MGQNAQKNWRLLQAFNDIAFFVVQTACPVGATIRDAYYSMFPSKNQYPFPSLQGAIIAAISLLYRYDYIL